MMQNVLTIKDFHLTSAQDAPYDPRCIIEQFYRCTPHNFRGAIRPTFPGSNLTSSGSFNTTWGSSFPLGIIAVNTDKMYFFTDSGEVLKLNQVANTFTSIHTLAPAAGTAKVYNCIVYGDYVYYAMEKRLGRFDLATETFSDNFATFTNGLDAVYHPMAVVNRDLYIGDGELVAIVDSTGTFTANALDIDPDYSVTSLFGWDNQLLIGSTSKYDPTTLTYRKEGCFIYRWNTWSVSFDQAVRVDDQKVCGFLVVDGGLFVLTQGRFLNIFQYTEPAASLYCRIPPFDFTNNKLISVYPMAVQNIAGKAYFGIGLADASEGYTPGLYTLYTRTQGGPPTIQLEHTQSGIDNGAHPNIYAIGTVPNVGIIFSWKQTGDGIGRTQGVDFVNLISNSPYTSFNFTTGYIYVDPARQKNFKVTMAFAFLPVAGTTTILMDVLDNIASTTPIATYTLIVDTVRGIAKTKDFLPALTHMKLQFRISATGSGLQGVMPSHIEVAFN